MSSDVSASELSRLRWRCRRGMRELDMLLTRWLEVEYPLASPGQRVTFQQLLEREDDEVWDWMMGRASPPEELKTIVHSICSLNEGSQDRV